MKNSFVEDARFQEITSPQRPEVAKEARLLLEDGEPIFADWAAVVKTLMARRPLE